MAPSTFVDMVRVASAGAGTGPLILGAPIAAFQGTTALIDGNQYSYSIQQEADSSWEYGHGIWNASTNTLERGIIRSSLGTDPIGLRVGMPISITVLAEDFAATDQAALAAAVASAQGYAAEADADTVATAADRVQTGLDRTATGIDRTAAAGSATAAANSATAANNSAVAADADAATAAGAVSTVTAAATAAAGSATTASTAATTATNAATAAGTSATNAATSATNAAGSATTAGNSAASTAADRVQTGLDRTAAANSATSAGLSELNAGNSATAAAGSATTAQNRATDAANSATAAAGSATNAFNSAVAAGSQVATAAASATAAAGSATTAAGSATTAGNSATAAAGSATTASTAATNAGNSATAAAGSATTASNAAATATTAVASTSANATTAQAAATTATNQAAIATTAASNPSFKVQTNPATPTVPPAGVSSGDTYWTVDASPATRLTLYLNTAGTGAPTATPVVDILTGAGASTNYVGAVLPGDNVGVPGDTYYYSSATNALYPQKTGAAWGNAIDLKTGALIPRVRAVTDFTIGAYPSSDLPDVRTGQITNLIVEDTARTPPVYGNNVAAQHPVYGVLGYPQSTYLMSSLNPGNGTFTVNMPVVGKLAIWMNGPGQVVSAAGATSPAAATNFGTLVSAPGVWQALNVTAGGNVALTLSGTDATTRIQVEYRTNQPTFSVPTPFAGATGTRTADSFLASGAMLSNWQAPTGTAIIDVHRLNDGGSGAATVIAFNGSSRLFIANDTTITYTDGTHSTNGGLLFQTFASGSARIVISWSPGSVKLFPGSAIPSAVAFDLNNSVARTSVRYTAPGTDGQQSLCGGIPRISFALNNAALDPVDCYDIANQMRPIPKASALTRDVEAVEPFPVWRDGLYEMSQGRVLTNGVWPIFIMVGASTTRGDNQVGATTWASSIAGRWAIRETAAGFPSYMRGLMGSAGYTAAGAMTNNYNPQMSKSAGWTNGWGTTAGGGTLSTTTAGCTESETPLEVTNGYRWFLFTNNGGVAGSYGRVQLTATDGTHTATKTFDCNIAPGVSMVELTAADLIAAGVVLGAGAVTYTLTTLDSGKRVSIAARFPWNSLTPHVIVLTAGAPGYTAEAMDIDSINTTTPENSWYEVLRQMQPTLMTLEIAGNSAVNQTAFTGFKTAIDNLITKHVSTGADVLMMTNLNLGTTVCPQNVQNKYQNYAIGRVRPLGGRGTVDLYHLFGQSADLVSMGLQISDKIHPSGLVDSTHPTSGNDIIAKRMQDLFGRAAIGV